MAFDPKIRQGEKLRNNDIRRIFQCSPQGGMRRSKKTGSLVVISDPIRGIYRDRWEGNILHYTGMGLKGDQKLEFSQNKTLAESNKNTVDVFLFEVFEPKKYTFQGKVELADTPYQERQLDAEGNLRNVWIFPLRLSGHQLPLLIEDKTFQENQALREKQASKLSTQELLIRAQSASRRASTRDVISRQHDRNQYVAELAKRRADGICQLCESSAPFIKKDGEPYLEIHHIIWLAMGGEDSIENTVALCPNCHRKMHILDWQVDRLALSIKALAPT